MIDPNLLEFQFSREIERIQTLRKLIEDGEFNHVDPNLKTRMRLESSKLYEASRTLDDR